jgi:putative ABC transport system permease protein
VVLAAVAIAMAAKRQATRQMDAAAVMRCLGAEQKTLQRIFLGQLLIAGLLGCSMGVVLAWGLQWSLGVWLSHALQIALPAASLLPALSGLLAGLVVLVSFAMPPILQLRRVPALRVLRRDLGPPELAASALVLFGLAALAALMIWQAGSLQVGGLLFAGLAATFLVLAALGALLMQLLTRLRHVLRGPLRYGLANAARRPLTTIAQVSALGMGLMVLLLLGFLQNDLIKQWRNELPPDFPNRFLINVQSDQADAMQTFFAEREINTTLVPMIRARLAAVNDEIITATSYRERGQRAFRLAQREFNLSANDRLSADNSIVEGVWWQPNSADAVISVEVEFAKRLGWKLGDKISFDIAGTPWTATITSLRKVKWESFSPNFFVIAPKAALLDYPASFIGSYRQAPLAKNQQPLESTLLAQFPNVSVLDLDTIIKQVQSITEQVARVVQAVFVFTLMAGILVLFAAVYASQDERLQEGAVMRALGAARAQLRLAQLSEFACLGGLACATALVAANVMMALLAKLVFRFDYAPDFSTQAITAFCAWILVCAAGVFATRRVVSVQPTQVLREL